MRQGPRSDRLVIVGATGDLAMRMLLPSLYFLDRDGFLADDLRVVGAARSEMAREAYIEAAAARLRSHIPADAFDEVHWRRFTERLDYVPLDADRPESFRALAERLHPHGGAQPAVATYLSLAPDLYGPVCEHLAGAGLAAAADRIALEKPIGRDLASCRALNERVAGVFSEDRVFRVDHYLGKETVQNLLALRFGNTLFEPLWNSQRIEQIQITVAETVGVEGRWAYYDSSGALRDMVQNHMLQLLCLVAMEPPTSMDADAVRDEKLKVLRSLRPMNVADVRAKTVAGQYTAGAVEGEPVPGYLEEGAGESATETFVALRADIDNWRWRGVPFYLRTGKRLPYRFTEIFIQFRGVPHSIFPEETNPALPSNKLVIRLQPQENIKLLLMNKVPGLGREGMTLKEVSLDLTQSAESRQRRRRIAYERLLLDFLDGNSTLFVRRDETEAAWAWIDRIAGGWRERGLAPRPYPAGSWGPSAAVALTERYGHSWHE